MSSPKENNNSPLSKSLNENETDQRPLNEIYTEWRNTKTIMANDPEPRKVRIPMSSELDFEILRSEGFDIKRLEAETWEEIPATDLKSLGKNIGDGAAGMVFISNDHPSTVIKIFYEVRSFIIESRIYLHARNHPEVPMPRLEFMYYLEEKSFDGLLGFMIESTISPEVDDISPPHRYCLGITKIEGETLENVIGNSDDLSNEEFAHLSRALRDGLKKLHAAGIAHGDLNPCNILVSSDRQNIYFIDFNGANLKDDDHCGETDGMDWSQLCKGDEECLESEIFQLRRNRDSLDEVQDDEANEEETGDEGVGEESQDGATGIPASTGGTKRMAEEMDDDSSESDDAETEDGGGDDDDDDDDDDEGSEGDQGKPSSAKKRRV